MTKPFFDSNSGLTAKQYEVIGRVALHWTLLEYGLERVLVRLACAPDFPGMALTNDLSINNRLTALKNLIEIHRHRYHSKLVPSDTLDELNNMRSKITRLKDRRNRIIHYVWFRRDDGKMFGIRFRGKIPTRGAQSTNYEILRLSDALHTSRDIEGLANRILELSRTLPERHETSL